MYLSVLYILVEGVGPRNVRPNQNARSSVLIGFPTCLSTYVFAYLRAPCSRRHDMSSVHSRTLCRQQEWQANINNPIFLPGIVVLLLTVL